jgi:hypothetical protein
VGSHGNILNVQKQNIATNCFELEKRRFNLFAFFGNALALMLAIFSKSH